jgi:hypothetical protein
MIEYYIVRKKDFFMLWLFIVYSIISLLAFGFWAWLFGGIACFIVLLIMDKRMAEMHNSMLEELQALDRQNLQLQKELKDKTEILFVGTDMYKEGTAPVYFKMDEISSVEKLNVSGWGDYQYKVVMKNRTVYLFTDIKCGNYNLDEFSAH